MRRIVLDTETTGLEPAEGHRIIEVACLELDGRRATGRHFHRYVNPERVIDLAATQVHGLVAEDLADKPRFGDIADEFLEFVAGCELLIHNAPFDMAFLNAELTRAGRPALTRRPGPERSGGRVVASRCEGGGRNRDQSRASAPYRR